ncbi:MAG TPA: hypothetical protein VK897_14465 [Anaerolineales bacterium]|nr:hypothetical protein [Anaerolineales bacterium]
MSIAAGRKPTRIYRSTDDLEPGDFHSLYKGFNSPVAELDCGKKCAPHNPSGKPFCCDICHAVPAAYRSEWKYLRQNTDLWHKWEGNECGDAASGERERLNSTTPANMLLLACLGPAQCQRPFRALSCRQFPFFPYVTSDYRFIGLAYEWEFEAKCWVINNLSQVAQNYREEFIRTYDRLFSLFQEEFEQYAYHSELLRAEFAGRNRRFPLLHRNGKYYLVSAFSERLRQVQPERLPSFGIYRDLVSQNS